MIFGCRFTNPIYDSNVFVLSRLEPSTFTSLLVLRRFLITRRVVPVAAREGTPWASSPETGRPSPEGGSRAGEGEARRGYPGCQDDCSSPGQSPGE